MLLVVCCVCSSDNYIFVDQVSFDLLVCPFGLCWIVVIWIVLDYIRSGVFLL